MSRRRERQLEDALAAEQARVERLLQLLMSRTAPQEYAAYVNTSEGTESAGSWIYDDTGLIATWNPEDE